MQKLIRQMRAEHGGYMAIDKKEKQPLSEIDICDLIITAAIKDTVWDQLQQIRHEVTLTPGQPFFTSQL